MHWSIPCIPVYLLLGSSCQRMTSKRCVSQMCPPESCLLAFLNHHTIKVLHPINWQRWDRHLQGAIMTLLSSRRHDRWITGLLIDWYLWAVNLLSSTGYLPAIHSHLSTLRWEDGSFPERSLETLEQNKVLPNFTKPSLDSFEMTRVKKSIGVIQSDLWQKHLSMVGLQLSKLII